MLTSVKLPSGTPALDDEARTAMASDAKSYVAMAAITKDMDDEQLHSFLDDMDDEQFFSAQATLATRQGVSTPAASPLFDNNAELELAPHWACRMRFHGRGLLHTEGVDAVFVLESWDAYVREVALGHACARR